MTSQRECIVLEGLPGRHDGRRVGCTKFFARRGSRRRNAMPALRSSAERKHVRISSAHGRSFRIPKARTSWILTKTSRSGYRRQHPFRLRRHPIAQALFDRRNGALSGAALSRQHHTPCGTRAWSGRGRHRHDNLAPTLLRRDIRGAGRTQFRSHPPHPDAPPSSRVWSADDAGRRLVATGLLRSQRRGCGCALPVKSRRSARKPD